MHFESKNTSCLLRCGIRIRDRKYLNWCTPFWCVSQCIVVSTDWGPSHSSEQWYMYFVSHTFCVGSPFHIIFLTLHNSCTYECCDRIIARNTRNVCVVTDFKCNCFVCLLLTIDFIMYFSLYHSDQAAK